jgi:hypothetical protein
VAEQHRRLVRRGKAPTAKERECRPPIPHSALTRFHQAAASIGEADRMAALNDHPSIELKGTNCSARNSVSLDIAGSLAA